MFSSVRHPLGLATFLVACCFVVSSGRAADEPLSGTRFNTATEFSQRNANIAVNASGSGVLAWESRRYAHEKTAIFARRLDASGTPVGDAFEVAGPTTEGRPSVAMSPDGKFLVTWVAENEVEEDVLRGRIFSPAGVPLTGEVDLCDDFYGSYDIAARPDGGFVAVWNTGLDTVARIYDASGAPLSERIHVYGHSENQSVGVDATGSFVIGWDWSKSATERGASAQRFDATGKPLGNELIVAAAGPWPVHSSIAVHPTGSFAVAWMRAARDGLPPFTYVQLRVYDPGVEPRTVVIGATSSEPWSPPAVTSDASGKILVSWDTANGIKARRLYPSGSPAGPEFGLTTTAGDNFSTLLTNHPSNAIAVDSTGAAFVAWSHNDPASEDSDVYAGKLPAFAQLVEPLPPTLVTARTATLNAKVRSHGSPTRVWADFGTYPVADHGTLTAPQEIGLPPDAINVSFPLTGLLPRTTYYYWIIAEDAHGRVWSERQTFQTPNTVPLARSDSLHVRLTELNRLNVLANDVDADLDPLSLTSVTNGKHGTTSIQNGLVAYSPAPTYQGNDSFQYTVSDPFGGKATTTVVLSNRSPTIPDATVHAPIIGAPTSVYTLGKLLKDGDGDSIIFQAEELDKRHSAVVAGSAVLFTSGGIEGAHSLQLHWRDDYGAKGTATINLRNIPPTAEDIPVFAPVGMMNASLAEATEDADGDSLSFEIASKGAFGNAALNGGVAQYTPGPSFEGRDSFTYKVSDRRGGTATGTVHVTASTILKRVLSLRGDPVGPPSEKEPAPTWVSFGAPSAAGEDVGWLGRARANRVFTGIYTGGLGAPTRHVQTGDLATDASGDAIDGVRFTAFRDPVFGNASSFAVVASIAGPRISAANGTGVWAKTNGHLRQVIMQGAPAPGVARGVFASFPSLVMNGEGELFIRARLRRGDPGAIGADNDIGLWRWTETDGMQLLLRTGSEIELVEGIVKKVRDFDALGVVPGSPGEGRYASEIPTRIRFTDGTQAIVRCGRAGVEIDRLSGGGTPFRAFGAADAIGAGDALVYSAIVAAPTPANPARVAPALLRSGFEKPFINSESFPELLNVRFSRIFDPVACTRADGEELVAFVGTVTSGISSRTGLWSWSSFSQQLTNLGRVNGPAPGLEGTVFREFQSLAMIPTRGPMFLASFGSAADPSAAARRGVWVTDSFGQLRLAAWEGEKIVVGTERKVVRSIKALHAVAGSPAQRRAVGEDPGRLIYHATFDDDSTSIVRVTIP